MASIEFLQKRIAGKEKELATLQKKMERILKAQASNYEQNNPYYYSDYDFRVTTKDIQNAEKALADYQAQLDLEEQKSASRNVQVILDFLEDWKSRVYEFYMNNKNGLTAFYRDSDEMRAMWREESNYAWGSPEWKEWEVRKNKMSAEWRIKCHGEYEEIPVEKRRYRWEHERKIAPGIYEWLNEITSRADSLEGASEYLHKTLDREAELKYDDMINRTTKIVGTITDASGLSIGAKGDLNGIIIGTDGKASIQTIGAGGYNIQCYHYRTLIKPVK